MKKIITIFIVWRLFLFLTAFFSPYFIPLKSGFLGKIGWDNMDGVHYVSIAKNSYFQYEQAFFPGYPLLIRFFSKGLNIDPSLVGFSLSNIFIFLASAVFYKLISEKFSPHIAKWSIIFLYIFPASFFFSAVYTESFFLFLILSVFYFSHKQKWYLAGLFGALASFTRLVGIFLFPALLIEWWLNHKKTTMKQYSNEAMKQYIKVTIKQLLSLFLIPLGLLIYMHYLYISVGDPLFFFHSQPFFGAGRSGNRLILLPQVIFRYLKIFTTASLSYNYFIAVLEILSLILAVYLLLKNLKKIPLSWQVFSWLSLLTPTLTGSLSSMPRYILTIVPLYYLLAINHKIVKYLLIIVFVLLQIILAGFFLQGYFVA